MPSSVILAIESSCDDTSASVCIDGKIISNIVANQQIHEQYGGVVPELASRAHIQNIIPVVDTAIQQANINKKTINAIAFTRGPGLLGSLLVGGVFAKTLSQTLAVPLIDVHHMEAHVMAHFIDAPQPTFPFLCLTVSGGHTQLVLVKDYLQMEIIGSTIDDAAGEAFDKTAKMLGLKYPGGPILDQLAQQGNPNAFKFTPSKVDSLDFSFSGFKTQVMYFLNKATQKNEHFIQENLNDLAASIQQHIVNELIRKLELAIEQYQVKQVGIAGGVAANSCLRNEINNIKNKYDIEVYIPKFEYCTDNAAMIAICGYYKYLKNEFCDITIPISPKI
ncbi:MAG: tRNA (adenosine(37)-N6)-threonylcarbamoyltransferase complex transferase subunit TsaD [Chitinophagales bacterium]|nr:tRNA (adenosine(37)-N6)-threonylcarbamoyltransferase complex transferase subunit TsaD [Chitinophagales bacterium]